MGKRDHTKTTIGTRDDSQLLRKTAEEMNEVMGLEPPLPTNVGREGHGALFKMITEESKEIDLKKDDGEFSKGVQAFLEREGLWPGSKKSKAKPVATNDNKSTKKEGEKEMSKKSAKKKTGNRAKSKKKKAAVVKKKTSKATTTTKGAGKNEHGIRKGTIADKVCQLIATGKCTMSDIKKKTGTTHYNLVNKLGNVKKDKDGILSFKKGK